MMTNKSIWVLVCLLIAVIFVSGCTQTYKNNVTEICNNVNNKIGVVTTEGLIEAYGRPDHKKAEYLQGWGNIEFWVYEDGTHRCFTTIDPLTNNIAREQIGGTYATANLYEIGTGARVGVTCSDECTKANQTYCDEDLDAGGWEANDPVPIKFSSISIYRCEDADGDGCLDKTYIKDCGTDSEGCLNGECFVKTCEDECDRPTAPYCRKEASGAPYSVYECADIDNDSCLEKHLIKACGATDSCTNSTCML